MVCCLTPTPLEAAGSYGAPTRTGCPGPKVPLKVSSLPDTPMGRFLEERAVPGVVEHDELLARRLQLAEPCVGEHRPAAGLVAAPHQTDRDLQGGDVDPEIDVLQLHHPPKPNGRSQCVGSPRYSMNLRPPSPIFSCLNIFTGLVVGEQRPPTPSQRTIDLLVPPKNYATVGTWRIFLENGVISAQVPVQRWSSVPSSN